MSAQSKNGYENKEGMFSPIEQNRKHINLIKKVLKEVFECDNVPVKSLVIMANPKTIIRKKYAPEEIQNQIIRAEKLGNYIETLDNELKKTVFKLKAELFLLLEKFSFYYAIDIILYNPYHELQKGLSVN